MAIVGTPNSFAGQTTIWILSSTVSLCPLSTGSLRKLNRWAVVRSSQLLVTVLARKDPRAEPRAPL